MTSVRRFFANSALVAGSLGIAIVATEIGLRILDRDWTASMMTNDPELGWSLRPRAQGWFLEEGRAWVEVNHDGMRDFERTIEKPAGTLRVAVLGDSTAESRQVDIEHSWPALLEHKLNTCPRLVGHRVEVLNFGVGGYGTTQELIMLEKRAWKYDPDVVLLAFYPGNDLYNNMRELNPTNPKHTPYYLFDEHGVLIFDDTFRTQPELDDEYVQFKDFTGEVMNKSRILRGLHHLYTQAGKQRAAAAAGGARDTRRVPVPIEAPAMERAWRLTEELLDIFATKVEEQGREPWMTTMTVAVQVHPDAKARVEEAAALGIYDLDYANRRIAELARRRGISHIEQLSAMRAHAEETGTPLHGFLENGRLNDGHLNEDGHVVVADVLAASLCADAFRELINES